MSVVTGFVKGTKNCAIFVVEPHITIQMEDKTSSCGVFDVIFSSFISFVCVRIYR
jgi:hypothetical protein